MGSTRVLGGAQAATSPTHRYGLSTTTTLLDALDAATSMNLGSTLFAPRFPTIY